MNATNQVPVTLLSNPRLLAKVLLSDLTDDNPADSAIGACINMLRDEPRPFEQLLALIRTIRYIDVTEKRWEQFFSQLH